MRIFFTIVAKELLNLMRSFPLVFLILYSFTVEVYVSGEGIQITPRNIAVGYVDNSGGGLSQKFLSNLHDPEFLTPTPYTSAEALSNAVFSKEIMIGIVFEDTFESDFRQNKGSKLNILLDATASSQAFTALNYLQNIALNFSPAELPIELVTHKLFNENADNSTFMSLTRLLSSITTLSIILTAMVFVKEKEEGTWDIMLLMPVDPKVIIVAKAFSQVLAIMVATIISLGLVIFGTFDAPINGSFFSFLLLTFLYAFAGAGIGLFIAALAENVVQVAQYAICIMMPLLFLSGSWTPIYAMHPALQFLSYASPLRYYIEAAESIFFRGTAFIDLIPYFTGVACVGGVVFYIGFRKLGRLF